MVERNMISGIKRKSTAVEGTKRYFQTVDLIISHFKREADKKKIYEILEKEESTLNNLLIATAAVHIYHNLGIRVRDALEMSQISSESTHQIELMEKKVFFNEVKLLLKDSLKLEIDMLYKIIDLENRILRFALEERENKLQEFEKQRRLKEIGDQIEQDLMDIIVDYPPFYFYDLIGDLIGFTDIVKLEVLEESSALKDLSVEIERKLQREEKEDKFIELATLNRIMRKTQSDFEFKSYTELQVQAMPVRMLKRKIIDYNLNKCPVSVSGLKSYISANETKRTLIKMIEDTLTSEIDYDDFENKITSYLKDQIIEILKSNPNDFIYFLENLNESDFPEIIYQLNKNGIYNILDIINTDHSLVEKIKKYMIRYNIDKFDFMSLNDNKKSVFLKLKKTICAIEIPFLKDFFTRRCASFLLFTSFTLVEPAPDFSLNTFGKSVCLIQYKASSILTKT